MTEMNDTTQIVVAMTTVSTVFLILAIILILVRSRTLETKLLLIGIFMAIAAGHGAGIEVDVRRSWPRSWPRGRVKPVPGRILNGGSGSPEDSRRSEGVGVCSASPAPSSPSWRPPRRRVR